MRHVGHIRTQLYSKNLTSLKSFIQLFNTRTYCNDLICASELLWQAFIDRIHVCPLTFSEDMRAIEFDNQTHGQL